MAMPDISVQVKQIAQAERVRAFQKKNPHQAGRPGPPAANPAAPKPEASEHRKPETVLCARIWKPWRPPSATGSRTGRSFAAR